MYSCDKKTRCFHTHTRARTEREREAHSTLQRKGLVTLTGIIKKARDKLLVSWCFKPSQLQRIMSGLRETFIKRYIAQRTNKAEIRPEGQREKAESCWENLRDEIQLKRP